jgi:copper resistance protein B
LRALPWIAASYAIGLATQAHAQHAHGASVEDPHAGHHMDMPMETPARPGPASTPPPVPTDFDADRYFPKAAMDTARAQLAHEHGHAAWSSVRIEKLEYRPGSPNGYAWEGEASVGGDIDRLVVKSRGEGDRRLERGEADLLWRRAMSPWFDLEAGARQDLQRGGRTHAVLGVEGLTPYEFEIDAALFLSARGELTARAEVAHDYRLTQRLILEPRVEADFAAQTTASQRTGSGLSRIELGLRLRYAISPAVAPYVGVEHERATGRTARLTRTAGEDPRGTRLVVGLRAGF